MPSSTCIGGGTDSVRVGLMWYHAPATDFDGDVRAGPDGTQKCDIGAQEEQITVDVTPRQKKSVTTYELTQNFPNPFNPRRSR